MRTKSEIRSWRKKRIRKKIRGDSVRPRLSVFRSASHIYAQVKTEEAKGGKSEVAKKVGVLVARKCLEHDIKKVVFDRNGFVYHGRIKALAEAAREAGLEF